MKHLTPTQYQYLPVNEKSNWKPILQESLPYWPYNEYKDCEIDGRDPIIQKGANTRTIYIPINPESVLNAEMGDGRILPQSRLRQLISRFENNDYDIVDVILRSYDEGKLDRSSEVIDIVEAEIKYFNSATCFDSAGVLTELLTKLKEIK